jgi:asparagine synthase (glutamine-hydrolysing)
MCGIHGALSLRNSWRPEPSLHRAMGTIAVHRGPDDDGFHLDGEVLIGMQRLSIIDLQGGHQPIANEDESLWMVCNGEIYNFRELRAKLMQRGHRFRTDSDSEVILHLYEEHGDEFVQRLDGMFAFALWDARRRRLLIGRDHVGIKPLYYRNDGERLLFASEAKSILAAPGVSASLSRSALRDYLKLGYAVAPNSMFEGISRLEPGSLLLCEGGRLSTRRYWRPGDQYGAPPQFASHDDWIAATRDHLERATRAQMVSDVPLGAFLSGGIDSSAVVAMMAGHSEQPVRTYAIGFGTDGSAGAFYNELPYAREVASLFGTQHREIEVAPDAARLLPQLLWHLDEPIADSAFITTYLVSRFAREDVKVILCGVGGDELFGGYRRYLGPSLDRYYHLIPKWVRHGVLSPIARRLPADRHAPLMNLARYARSYVLADELDFADRYRAYIQVFAEGAVNDLLVEDEKQRPGADALARAFEAHARVEDPLRQLMHVDMETQLPDDLLLLTDKMSMATSLECRVPFLDRSLVEFASAMPASLKIRGRTLKHVLKQALAGTLPEHILHRRKRGFGAPMGAWLRAELRPLLNELLSREVVEARGLLRWPVIEQTIRQHENAEEDHTDHLLALLNLEVWSRLYLDGNSVDDVSASLGEAAHGRPAVPDHRARVAS